MRLLSVNKGYVKSKIDLVRRQIGRNVTFYTSKSSICTDCVASGFYNPATDTSFNFVCPLCKGSAYTNSVEPTEVLARVHWAGDERITATPGGKYYVGECTLTIDPSYHELAQDAQKDAGKVVVDGRDMFITGIDPLGAPEINRIRLRCISAGTKITPA